MPKYLDRNGLTYLWSKISMEDYPNNETLVAVLNAIDKTKADKDDFLLYKQQELTEEQKQQARINIETDYASSSEIIEMMIQEGIIELDSNSPNLYVINGNAYLVNTELIINEEDAGFINDLVINENGEGII